jgi:HEAT repeat protein
MLRRLLNYFFLQSRVILSGAKVGRWAERSRKIPWNAEQCPIPLFVSLALRPQRRTRFHGALRLRGSFLATALRVTCSGAIPFAVILASSYASAAEAPLPVDKLVSQLETGDVATRRDASYYLMKLGPKAKDALPVLIKALDDQDKQVWSNSVSAIAAIGPEAKEAIPALIDDLDSKRGRGQRGFDKNQALVRSAYALTRIGPAAIPPLIQALGGDDTPLRAGAAKALGGMGPAAKEAIPALISNLKHADNDVQREVIESLVLIGADAKPPVIAALSSKESRERSAASMTLAGMGRSAQDAAPAMFDQLGKETDVTVRVSLLTALPKIGAEPKTLVPRLIDALKDQNDSIRHAAINGLLSFPSARKEIVESLTALLRDPNKDMSQRAAYVVGRFGVAAASAVPVLLEIIAKQSPPDPVFIDALVQIGEPAVPQILTAAEKVPLNQLTAEHWMLKCLQSMGAFAVNSVRNGLGHKDASVRLLSVRALTALGHDARDASTSLLEKLDDPEVQVRAAALGALVAVDAPSKLMLPRIEKSLNDASPVVRLAAAKLVPKLGDEGKHLNAAVIDKLNDPDASVRRGILDAFGPEQAGAIPALLPLLDKADLRLPVVQALGRMGGSAMPALPKLVELLPKLPNDGQVAILDCIAHIGPAATEARPAIDPLRSHADVQIRARAIYAAAAIEGNPQTRATLLAGALDDADASVRKSAADAIVPLGDKLGDAATKLFELLKTDRDRELALVTLRQVRVRDLNLLSDALTLPQPEVKIYACEAIGRMGKDGRGAAPALEPITGDSNEEVARSARRALRAIGAR